MKIRDVLLEAGSFSGPVLRSLWGVLEYVPRYIDSARYLLKHRTEIFCNKYHFANYHTDINFTGHTVHEYLDRPTRKAPGVFS